MFGALFGHRVAIASWLAGLVAAVCLSGCDACTASRGNVGPHGQTIDTTESVLARPSAACAACAARNGCLDPTLQGGRCELTAGRVPMQPAQGRGPSLPRDPSSPAGYTANCLQTLRDVFASGCAASLALTPCLCGSNPSAGPCLDGREPPRGPVVADYVKSFGTSNIQAIQQDFTDPTFGAGQANGIVQCLAAFSCGCCFGADAGC